MARAREQMQYMSPTSTAPVVVGFDGADGGRDALELARVLATIRDSPCIVAMPEIEDLADEAKEIVGPASRVCAIGVVAPAQMLVELAKREHAGTLVIGASRAGKIARAMLGHTGANVLAHAPCEVLVAPRDYAASHHEGYAKIAVAVDGTPESKVALTRAEDLARQAGATIKVLVADDPVVSSFEAEFPHDAPSSLSNVLEAAVDSVDPALSPTGKQVETGRHQIVRTIATALAKACEPDVDLLVMGSQRPIAHVFGGSVTKHLIDEAHCPVLVVPHSREV